MNYLPREIDSHLLRWAQKAQRKPIMLRGARQVGKTSVVRALAHSAQLSLCEINFERNPRLRLLFQEAAELSPKTLLPLCEVLLGQEIKAGRTLVFFDEIQECPEAITALRYFYEEMPELHVISAGSLLDFTLNRVSVPVGRVSFMVVRPMSFAEFLIATNREKWNLERPHCLSQPAEHTIPTAMHLSLRDALRDYMIVGGMPSCVAEYKTSKNFVNVREIQADIVQTYLADVRKYTRGDSQIHNVGEVMANAFSFVGKQINYTVLGHGDAIKRTKQSVLLLEQAHVIHIVRAPNEERRLRWTISSCTKVFPALLRLNQALLGV